MANEYRAFDDELAARGVTRRDFVKFCGSVAAMLGLSEAMVPQIVSAVESAASSKLHPAVWMNGGACTGCTESMAQATYPDVATVVLDILSMNFMETVMMAQGLDAEHALYDTIKENKGKTIMIYEGSVMKGWDGNALRLEGKTSLEILDKTAPDVAAIIAVGSCAVDGGWVIAEPNPADATGVSMYLAEKGIKTPVINLPTCPVNPEWIVAMVVDVLLLGSLESGAILDKLDDQGRPKLIFGQTIHDNCPRRGHFENGEFVYEFGSEEERKNYCLYPVGCKGPTTFTNCPIVRWNNQVSWCVESGSPCIGCGGFDWVDVNAPFLGRMRQVGLGTGTNEGGFNPGVAGAVAGGAMVGALGVHALGMKAAGRIGNMPPTEEMKERDRKKGGDK